jgi:predicted metal-binding membrane protein
MSMIWMRMPAQTWLGATASFLAMWTPMMVAMMLPSLVPVLARCRTALAANAAARRGRLTALVALGYGFVWVALGAAVYAGGVTLAGAVMRAPALARLAPLACGAVVFLGGAFQWSRWKMRHLACWRDATDRLWSVAPNARSAWRHGVRLGIRCSYGCAGLTASLLAVGMMDPRAMAAVTAAVTAERLAPGGRHIARVVGAVGLAVGSFLMLHARAFI